MINNNKTIKKLMSIAALLVFLLTTVNGSMSVVHASSISDVNKELVSEHSQTEQGMKEEAGYIVRRNSDEENWAIQYKLRNKESLTKEEQILLDAINLKDMEELILHAIPLAMILGFFVFAWYEINKD